jgi:uracil-DNA glycosylase family 4
VTSPCTLCPVHQESKANCVGARPALFGKETLRQKRKKDPKFKGHLLTGKEKIRYLLVGEALGSTEDKLGVPFIGPAGSYLDKVLEILQRNGLDLSEVALTNAIRCHPEDNRNPKMAEKRACRPYLDDEVRKLKPELVVALGGQAWTAMLNQTNAPVAKDRLKVMPYLSLKQEVQLGSTQMAVTYHPAAVLRDKTRARPLFEDLTALLIQEHHLDKTEEDRPQTWTVNNMTGLETVLNILRHEKCVTVSLDIETASTTANVLTVALSFPPFKRAYVLPVHHPESALPGRYVMEQLRELILEKEGRLVIGQNVKYDLGRMSWYFGEPVTLRCLADDCMTYHYSLDEHAPTRSLDYFSRRYTKTGGYKEEINKADLINEPLEKVAKYNGTDAAIPPGIIAQLVEEQKGFGCYSPELIEFYRRIVPFVGALEANGMRIDLEALEVARDLHDHNVAKAEKAMRRVCGDDLNLRSAPQMRDYLFSSNGLGLSLPDIPRQALYTPKGEISTAEPMLAALKGQHPFVDRLGEFRTAGKMREAYVEAIYKNVYPDQCVHPSYFIVRTAFSGNYVDEGGTVSGRLSAKGPAVQTIPGADPVKRAYASRYKGGYIMNIDGAQMELRYGGWRAGDDNIRKACEGDPHQWVADLVGAKRAIGKRTVFASIYGVTADGLVEKAGLAPAVAKKIAPLLAKKWARLYDYLQRVGNDAVSTGQVCTPYNAFRRVPDANWSSGPGRHLVRSAQNYVIQRASSDLVLILGWRLMLELHGLAIPITSTHDSITFDVPKGKATKTHKIMQAVVKEQWKVDAKEILSLDLGRFPFAFDLTRGPNWLDQTDVASFQC